MRPITAVMLDVVLVGGDAVMCEQGVEDGTEDTSLWSSMFVMRLASVIFPIPIVWRLPVRKSRSRSQRNRVETKRGQFVAEFVGDHRVEGRVVVHKEHPKEGVFVFQVGQSASITLSKHFMMIGVSATGL